MLDFLELHLWMTPRISTSRWVTRDARSEGLRQPRPERRAHLAPIRATGSRLEYRWTISPNGPRWRTAADHHQCWSLVDYKVSRRCCRGTTCRKPARSAPGARPPAAGLPSPSGLRAAVSWNMARCGHHSGYDGVIHSRGPRPGSDQTGSSSADELGDGDQRLLRADPL